MRFHPWTFPGGWMITTNWRWTVALPARTKRNGAALDGYAYVPGSLLWSPGPIRSNSQQAYASPDTLLFPLLEKKKIQTG
jgi:hypothetical protein